MKCMKAMGSEMDGDIAGPALKKAQRLVSAGWSDVWDGMRSEKSWIYETTDRRMPRE